MHNLTGSRKANAPVRATCRHTGAAGQRRVHVADYDDQVGNQVGGPISRRQDLQRRFQDHASGFLANSADGYGGGIYTHGTRTGDHIAITTDDAGFDGGSIHDGNGGSDPATLSESTVFGNQCDNCPPTGAVTDCFV